MGYDNSIQVLMNGLYDKLKCNTSFVDYEYPSIPYNNLYKFMNENKIAKDGSVVPYFFEEFNKTHNDYKLKSVRHIKTGEFTKVFRVTNNPHERGRVSGTGRYSMYFSIYFDKVK